MQGRAAMIGRMIGAYHVTAKLGEGGMGEVYRATDTKLKRDVALKVLPAALAQDSERVARLQREAEMLASLNHVNIAQIHGVEDADGSKALAMELVEGLTLAERIAQGPMSVDEVVEIARQIAEALGAAHEAGVVHRDLKPANIKIRPDGTVKVLDFGVAKAWVSAGDTGPTITALATREGALIGTPDYMSPEQAEGKPVDQQTDIWAFGATLFEALTGRQPFSGQTIQETLASVLARDPDWAAVPPRLRRLVRWCLQKNPKRRLHDIRDAVALLDEPEEPSAVMPAASRRAAVIAAAAVIVAVLAIVWAVVRPADDAGANRVRYVDLALPSATALVATGTGPVLAASINGTIAFVGETDGAQSIWVRPLDAPLARRLAGTEGARSVFWAPDGRNLGFYAPDVIRRIDIETGVIRDVASTPTFRGASWGTRGTILYGRLPGGLVSIDASGNGPAVPVTEVTSEEQFHYYPHFLPDGERFLYTTETGVWMGSTAGAPGQRDRVLVRETASNTAYVPAAASDSSGLILFTAARTLYAQRFDPDAAAVSGTAVAIAEGVGTGNLQRVASFSAPTDDVLVASPPEENPGYRLVSVSASGDRQGDASGSRGYLSLDQAPDGMRVAALAVEADYADLGVVDLTRGSWTTLATGGIFPYFTWSPSGQQIAYTSLRDRPALFRVQAAGGDRVELTPGISDERHVWDWVEAGLVYGRRRSDTRVDLELLRLQDSETRSLVADGSYNYAAQVSPDGRWLAFVSDASGRDEVYVQPFPDPDGQREPVSVDGGSMPVWNADGSVLYFESPRGELLAVDVTASPRDLELGRPATRFVLATRPRNYPGARQWIHRPEQDGFLVIRPTTFSTASVRLMLGWGNLVEGTEQP